MGAMPAAPPAYPYPGVPGGMPVGGVDLRRGVRVALIVMLSLMLPVTLLVMAARFAQADALETILDHGPLFLDRGKVEDADDFYAVAILLYFLTLAATATLWAVWFRRTRVNAEVFAPGTHRFGTGWAAGAWFTPVVNFWFPKQIANDIYRASSPTGPQNVRKGLLNAWWVLWIAATACNVVSSALYSVATNRNTYDGSDWHDNVSALKSSVNLSGLAFLLYFVAALLAILVVRQLTKMQEQRAAMGPQPMAPMGGMPYGAPAAPGFPPAPPYGAPYPPHGQPQNPFGSGPAAY
ncbi:DUF4328 domain-containing protein [Streptomyces cinnamoneus]|nr:DUF4328 domain-containing protein [Streptomyces cinnamoneus]